MNTYNDAINNYNEKQIDVFIQMFIAAFMIVLGVIFNFMANDIKNGTISFLNSNTIKRLGNSMFVVGWLGITYLLSKERTGLNYYSVMGASISIVVINIALDSYKDYNNNKGIDTPAWVNGVSVLFAGLWLFLIMNLIPSSTFDNSYGLDGIQGYFTNIFNGGLDFRLFLSIIAYVFMISSTLVLQPWQRKNKVVNSPGYVLQLVSWVIISYLNSSRDFS